MVTKLADHKAKVATAANANAPKAKTAKPAKMLHVANAAEVEKYAKQIVTGHNKARGLAQDVSVAVIEHMSEHGDYTIVYPLTTAMQSMGRNFYGPWLDWMESHSWLRIKPSVTGRQRNTAKPADLWSRDANMKPADNKPLLEKAKALRKVKRGRATVEEPNNFWTFKKPDTGDTAGRELNVPDSVARFIARLQAGIDGDLCVDEKGNPMRLAAIKKMVVAQLETLKPKAIIAGRVEPVAARAAAPNTEAKVA